MRNLYDIDYLESGCTLPYDENTNVDNTTWTWATSYAIAGTAFMSAALIAKKQKKRAILMTVFFALTGIGHAVTGASHQFAQTRDSWENQILGLVGVAVILFGNAFFMRTGILFFFFSLSLIANTLWVCITGGVIALTIVFDAHQLVAGLALGVTYLGMCMLYCWVLCWEKLPGSKWAMFAKVLAMWTNIGAIVEQFVLSMTCGSGGYADCFEACPLRNPTVFNQNAIFHILLIGGMFLLTIGEVYLPTHKLWDYYGSDDDGSDWETRKSFEEP